MALYCTQRWHEHRRHVAWGDQQPKVILRREPRGGVKDKLGTVPAVPSEGAMAAQPQICSNPTQALELDSSSNPAENAQSEIVCRQY